LQLHETYVSRSRYYSALKPFFERFGPALLVVKTEDLTGSSPEAWWRILEHLGLERVARPGGASNVGSSAPRYTPAMRVLHDRGYLSHLSRIPRPIRRMGRRLLVSDRPLSERLESSVSEPVPAHVTALLRTESELLAAALEWDDTGWPSTTCQA
jgi:hypothetical protein